MQDDDAVRDRVRRRFQQQRRREAREQRALLAHYVELERRQRELALRLADVRQRLDQPAHLARRRRRVEVMLGGVRQRRPPECPVVPPPPRDAVVLRGRALRSAALAILLREDRTMALAEIHRAIHLDGCRVGGANPVKRLADALGYEHRKGRAVRVERGYYRAGRIASSTARRYRAAYPPARRPSAAAR